MTAHEPATAPAINLGIPVVRPAHGHGNLHATTAFPAAAKEQMRNSQMRANIRHATHTIRGKRAVAANSWDCSATPGPR